MPPRIRCFLLITFISMTLGRSENAARRELILAGKCARMQARNCAMLRVCRGSASRMLSLRGGGGGGGGGGEDGKASTSMACEAVERSIGLITRNLQEVIGMDDLRRSNLHPQSQLLCAGEECACFQSIHPSIHPSIHSCIRASIRA